MSHFRGARPSIGRPPPLLQFRLRSCDTRLGSSPEVRCTSKIPLSGATFGPRSVMSEQLDDKRSGGRIAAITAIQERVCAELNEGAPFKIATTLFESLKEFRGVGNEWSSQWWSRKSAAEAVRKEISWGSFKRALRKIGSA